MDILEIGCGQGICSDKTDLDGRKYTGIELSSLLVSRAKELYRHENRRFLVANAYALPFSDGAFDAAFSVAVWHLLADLKKAAEELSRVLKAGGHFLIITADPGAYSAWTGRYTDIKLDGRRFEGAVQLPDKSELREVLYLHTLDEIMKSLQAVGLKIHMTETIRNFISIQGQRLVCENY